MLWLALGILIGVGCAVLLSWARKHDAKISILAWILLAVALAGILVGVQNIFGLMQEYETRAAWYMIPLFIVPSLVPAVLAVLLVRRGMKKAVKAS